MTDTEDIIDRLARIEENQKNSRAVVARIEAAVNVSVKHLDKRVRRIERVITWGSGAAAAILAVFKIVFGIHTSR